METIKPPNDFHAGTAIIEMHKNWSEKRKTYPSNQYLLDLSDVVFMDSHSFRIVFNFLPMFSKVIPPRNNHIVEMYDAWLDSKKGLSKG